jgi:hypothetical protein
VVLKYRKDPGAPKKPFNGMVSTNRFQCRENYADKH